MNKLDLQIEVEVNPTEDQNKVARAVENVFGNMKFELKPKDGKRLLVATDKGITGLAKFGDLLRRERIRDAARGVFLNSLSEKMLTFYLNKQVAYAGHVSFSNPTGESPLGSIRVEICCDNLTELIDWLAPKTARQ